MRLRPGNDAADPLRRHDNTRGLKTVASAGSDTKDTSARRPRMRWACRRRAVRPSPLAARA